MRYSVFNTTVKNLKLYHTPAPTLTKAYLLGALHDSTERKYTYRVSQKSYEYVSFIADGIKALGFNAWTYREGKRRDVYVVEFAKRILADFKLETIEQKVDYIRGYFDTEGCVPRSLDSRYYVYFAQKDLEDLEEVRDYLVELGVNCGAIHNPSKRVDPDYFRFYVLSDSFERFGRVIGSWHPVKQKFVRMKI